MKFPTYLIIAGIAHISATIMTPIMAHASTPVEAVAVIETQTGIIGHYTIGLSFTNEQDCQKRAKQINIMFTNLRTQGIGHEAIRIDCLESIRIPAPASSS